jgi:hypothetical protein
MPATPMDVATTIEAGRFRDRLAGLDMSIREFARRVGVHYNTARGWGTVRDTGDGIRTLQAFPTWVSLVLDAWETLGVPK